MPMHWFGGGWMMFLTWFAAGAFVILVTMLAIALAGGSWRSSTRGRLEESPEEILRKRFARGEIDENEFRKRRDELRAEQ